MDLEDILAPPGGVGSRQAFDAVVATPAPVSVSSPLFVTVPALDGGRSAIECRWQGTPGSLPGVGDRCLLVETSDGDAPTFWATGFDGRDVPLPASMPPSGPAGGALAGTYPNPTLGGTYKATFPFAAGWADSGAASQEGATYSKYGRVVTLQGAVTKTSGAPAANDVIGTLPAGFRPAGTLVFPVVTGPGVNTFGVVTVGSSGAVSWFAGSAAETDYTSLSGISFITP